MSLDQVPEIIPAEQEDIAAIQKIAGATWADTYAGVIPESVQEQLLSDWYASTALEETIRSGQTIFLVAKAQQRPVAFAQFMQVSPDAATLSRIYVLPEYQNQQIGSRLLETGIAKLKASGVTRVLVSVERDNQIGRRFYSRKSFREISASRVEFAGYALPVVLCELVI